MTAYRVTILASVPSDHRVNVPTTYSQAALAALIRERSAAQDYIDFDDQPDDVVLAEVEANEELRRIAFDAPHVRIEEVETMTRNIELTVTRAELAALRIGVDQQDDRLAVFEAIENGGSARLTTTLKQASSAAYNAFCESLEAAREDFEAVTGTHAGAAAHATAAAAAATLASKIDAIGGDRSTPVALEMTQEVA